MIPGLGRLGRRATDAANFPSDVTWPIVIFLLDYLKFGAKHNLIDGKTFNGQVYSQVMKLNSGEEWKISNEANDKSHPFHIYVNPFQITEVFEPNGPDTACVDKMNPETWKPCTPIPAPYVWWDTFAIPTSKQYDVTSECQGAVNRCPQQIQPYVQCSTDQAGDGKWVTSCTETIPGYFKMRSRFVDFTGTYVLHCHILIHEDRGMMQLVGVSDDKKDVLPDKPPYAHH
jgi:L-ascorbate oxidase